MSVKDGDIILGYRSSNVCPFADEVLAWCKQQHYDKHNYVGTEKLIDDRYQVKEIGGWGNFDPRPDIVEQLRRWLQGVFRDVFGMRAQLLDPTINKYEPHEVIGWHSDMYPDVVTFSVGGSRTLRFRPRPPPKHEIQDAAQRRADLADPGISNVTLKGNDLFVFNSFWQSRYQHSINAEPDRQETRYTFVFLYEPYPLEDPRKCLVPVPQQFTPATPIFFLHYSHAKGQQKAEYHVEPYDSYGRVVERPYRVISVKGVDVGMAVSYKTYAEAMARWGLEPLLKPNPACRSSSSSN